MALSPERLEQAKLEAREFVEYSLFVTATLLGVPLDEVASTLPIPVSEDDLLYNSYVSLKRQAAVLEGLNG